MNDNNKTAWNYDLVLSRPPKIKILLMLTKNFSKTEIELFPNALSHTKIRNYIKFFVHVCRTHFSLVLDTRLAYFFYLFFFLLFYFFSSFLVSSWGAGKVGGWLPLFFTFFHYHFVLDFKLQLLAFS